jgi:hypothetical protein
MSSILNHPESARTILDREQKKSLDTLFKANVPALFSALQKTKENLVKLENGEISRKQAIVIVSLTDEERDRTKSMEVFQALDWLVGNPWICYKCQDDHWLEKDLSILDEIADYVFIPYHLYSPASRKLLEEVCVAIFGPGWTEEQSRIFIDDIFVGDAHTTARTTFTVDELLLPFIESESGRFPEETYDALDEKFLKRMFE